MTALTALSSWSCSAFSASSKFRRSLAPTERRLRLSIAPSITEDGRETTVMLRKSKTVSVLVRRFFAILFLKKMTAMDTITIQDYQPVHQPYFERFNRQWIEKDFGMEPLDEFVLKNPEKAILEPGGAILMAICNGEPAGTVGLRRLSDTVFEFTKMTVSESFRRRGIAEALSYASFEKAAALGATEVVLYSNKKNTAAIQLYEKIGFRHLVPEAGVYARADVKMTINMETALLALQRYRQRMIALPALDNIQ